MPDKIVMDIDIIKIYFFSIRIRIGFGYLILGIGYGQIKTLPDQIEFEYGRDIFVPFTSLAQMLTCTAPRIAHIAHMHSQPRLSLSFYLFFLLQAAALHHHGPWSDRELRELREDPSTGPAPRR